MGEDADVARFVRTASAALGYPVFLVPSRNIRPGRTARRALADGARRTYHQAPAWPLSYLRPPARSSGCLFVVIL